MKIPKTDFFKAITATATRFIFIEDGKIADAGSLECLFKRCAMLIREGLVGEERTAFNHATFVEFSTGSRLYKGTVDNCGKFRIDDDYICYYAEQVIECDEKVMHKFMCYVVNESDYIPF